MLKAHDYAITLTQLLGELLLDRHNYLTMDRYIGSADNLKLMMTMLADQSRSIAYEAFHVFKVSTAESKFLNFEVC